MEKQKIYVDIIAHNNINRAKTEYNLKKTQGQLVDGNYEIVHPTQGWRSNFTITANTCVCDYYDSDNNLISHSEYTDPNPDEWPQQDFDTDLYEIIDIRGLNDNFEEI